MIIDRAVIDCPACGHPVAAVWVDTEGPAPQDCPGCGTSFRAVFPGFVFQSRTVEDVVPCATVTASRLAVTTNPSLRSHGPLSETGRRSQTWL